MTDRSVTHASFVIERTYAASPARVFAAFADPAVKKQWFASPDEMGPAEHEIDFRVGGRELNRAGPPGGPVYTFEAVYQDIVPDQRIVSTYEMQMNETRISVSVATVELKPEGTGTLLVYTEQGAFLDGHDSAQSREQGTGGLLDTLGKELARQATSA